MLDELQVGVIRRTHGVHGELKVYTTSDDPYRFETLREVILSGRGKRRTARVEGVRYFKDLMILKLEGIDDPETAAQLCGMEILIPRSEAMELGENEYFIGDLIGCRVFTDEGKLLGELTDVLQTGANDVYQVKTEDGGEVLLPAIRECILRVEPEKGEILVHLMKGLL